jgi:hypothetical protein
MSFDIFVSFSQLTFTAKWKMARPRGVSKQNQKLIFLFIKIHVNQKLLFDVLYLWLSSTSAIGLVVKYLVAIEMPRVRFPDGATFYSSL